MLVGYRVVVAVKRFTFALLILLAWYYLADNATKDRSRLLEEGKLLQESRQCSKQRKIGFLKTHKCASSSIQNILLRYGIKNQLNFVMPKGGNYLGVGKHYNRSSMLADTPWEQAKMEYNIFCLHTKWKQEEVEKTIGENAAYFTILRDPITRFESSWGYANLQNYFKVDLETFALTVKEGKLPGFNSPLARNQMLADMGFQTDLDDNVEAVDRMIQQAEQNFHLVMIAERWDESIVLMKDLLCWDFMDVVNLKLNSRTEVNVDKLSDKAKEALKEYLSADYKLYNHFLGLLDDKIHQLGARKMELELDGLKQANEDLKEKCGIKAAVNSELEGENKLWGSEKLIGYSRGNETDDEDCRLSTMAELPLLKLARDIQKERAEQVLAKANPPSV